MSNWTGGQWEWPGDPDTDSLEVAGSPELYRDDPEGMLHEAAR